MVEVGYALSSEEHAATDLVRYARRAEEMGFTFALISDHFHPWVDRQGHSPFVWSVLGGIAQVTERLVVGTGVTCPTIRIHPAIIAHAAATVATLMPGRFFLGLGTGEYLNEHILGDRWPPVPVRQEMLEEAVEVIRGLWQGGYYNHRGRYYLVENARLYDLPPQPVPIMIAASGPRSAALAGRIADGFISTMPSRELVQQFEAAGGRGKPIYGQIHVTWARTEEEARKVSMEYWPIAGLKGPLNSELALPRYFEQAAQMLREEDVARSMVLGPDPSRHVQAIKQFADAGFTHVYVHQTGPDQEGFFQFYQREVMPKLRSAVPS